MPRRVFYSFHYDPDVTRVAKLRNIGVIEGNRPCTDNDWESVKRGGDKAIQRWIHGQLQGRSCTVVMVGAGTARRKWIDYEIIESWKKGMGVFGVYIHNISDIRGNLSIQGANPFQHITLGTQAFSDIVPCYNPPHANSAANYNFIAANLDQWIENALAIRRHH